MIRRRSSSSTADDTLVKVPVPGASEEVPDGGRAGGKGRPTPKRAEAEKQRRQAVRPPKDRKEAVRLQRERARQERQQRVEALRRGDERALPARDKGPVRRFVRDWVDSRWNLAELFLPVAVVVVVLSFVPVTAIQAASIYVMFLMFIGIILDAFITSVRLRRILPERFPDEQRKGAVAYAVLRALQLRRLRLPAPQVQRGTKV
ncbi:DUF3043 domain-containing protein [Motilibacter aurantiacus]|uniref:DUF3043 domain-containing protein n=1 Tax=Motilibacter aurantiacus TaxID=2714955 RepID=UPI002F2B5E3B